MVMTKKKTKLSKVRVTLVKSTIGYAKNQRETAYSLGLRKLNASVEHYDTPQVRGMIDTIQHLVRVEEINE